MTDWLRRDKAPLSEKVWRAIDDVAITMVKQTLVARRIADMDGPRGWDHVGTQLGTFRPASIPAPAGRVRFSVPDVMMLTEIRAEFTLSWAAIDTFERGGPTLDAEPVEEASRQTALAEDRLILFGGANMPGLLTSHASPRVALSDWSIPGRAVTDLLMAVQKLDELGIKGPYEALLSPSHYYSFLRTTVEGGSYPAAKQLQVAVANVHSSPVIDGAALFSARGGDFLITVGGDFSIGYRWHDQNAVYLLCVETIAAQSLTPRALCLIKPD